MRLERQNMDKGADSGGVKDDDTYDGVVLCNKVKTLVDSEILESDFGGLKLLAEDVTDCA